MIGDAVADVDVSITIDREWWRLNERKLATTINRQTGEWNWLEDNVSRLERLVML